MTSNQDTVAECLSGCRYGEAMPISGTSWSAPTEIHDISSSGVIDGVHLEFWNTTATEIEVSLVLNPNDTATQADVDASTVPVLVPPNASIWALDGHKFRRHATAIGTLEYTVAAYVGAGDADDVIFDGYFIRVTQAEETA